jgi:hypothetical protein
VAAAAAAASERLSNKRPPGAGKHGAQDGAAQQKENHARARVFYSACAEMIYRVEQPEPEGCLTGK